MFCCAESWTADQSELSVVPCVHEKSLEHGMACFVVQKAGPPGHGHDQSGGVPRGHRKSLQPGADGRTVRGLPGQDSAGRGGQRPVRQVHAAVRHQVRPSWPLAGLCYILSNAWQGDLTF